MDDGGRTADATESRSDAAADDLRERVVVLTGGTAGIGRAAALSLAERGATVAVTGRDAERGDAVARSLQERGPDDDGAFFRADFASLDAVRELAAAVRERFDRIDALVHNAALSADERTLTGDGYELTVQVNHLAPYLLTHDLAGRLVESAPARVVVVASAAHRNGALDLDDLHAETGYDAFGAYATSKLANVLFARELADRLAGTGVTANAVHPGFVPGSRLYRGASLPVRVGVRVASVLPGVGTSVEAAGERLVYLATAPAFAETTGRYFEGNSPVEEAEPSAAARDSGAARRLWDASADLVGVDPALPVEGGS